MSTPEFDFYLHASLSGHVDKLFRNHIAGASHKDQDGSSRRQVMKTPLEGDPLQLVPELENALIWNAIAVFTRGSGQVGYLEGRLTGEVTRSMAKGREWGAFVQNIATSEGHRRVGLIAVIFRAKPGVTFRVVRGSLEAVDASALVPEHTGMLESEVPATPGAIAKRNVFWARLLGR